MAVVEVAHGGDEGTASLPGEHGPQVRDGAEDIHGPIEPAYQAWSALSGKLPDFTAAT